MQLQQSINIFVQHPSGIRSELAYAKAEHRDFGGIVSSGDLCRRRRPLKYTSAPQDEVYLPSPLSISIGKGGSAILYPTR